MLLGYITLITALIISISAAVYSIMGLTAIFASAFWPVVVLGGSLEVGKIVTTLWLHKHWDRAESQYKLYLSFAVAALMLMTSMGVFGFLSKAHSDQSLVSGDVQAKIAVYDEKLKIEKDNIDVNRKSLKQMDEAVDQTMGRSTSENGADKAISVRRSQQKERNRLLTEITESQKRISVLNEERAPIATQVRKVEAEVGPIKYIAALIYGDNADSNVLEKAVRWVIILIVSVFDPLALTLLLAATKTFEWEKQDKQKLISSQKEPATPATKTDFEGVRMPDGKWTQTGPIFEYQDDHPEYEWDDTLDTDVGEKPTEEEKAAYEQDDGPLTEEQVEQIKADAELYKPTSEIIAQEHLFKKADENQQQYESTNIKEEEPYLDVDAIVDEIESSFVIKQPEATTNLKQDIEPYGNELHQHSMRVWKNSNPNTRYIDVLEAYDRKEIDHIPWLHPEHIETLNLSDRDAQSFNLTVEADNDIIKGEVKGFGSAFPKEAAKGDMFLRVDSLPSQLFKFNGNQWIRVNKNLSDAYVYDDAYIDHLIEKIASGEYDPDLLSDIERDHISKKLKDITG